MTIFLTSHDAGDIESLAHRTMVINHGRLMFDDSTANFRGQYISTKTVELHLDEDASRFDFAEGVVTDRGKFSVTIELPLGSKAMERLLEYTVENFQLKDLNIFEPPMEEIISRMYQDQSAIDWTGEQNSPLHTPLTAIVTPPLIS